MSDHTPGPWELIIDDCGGKWSGWPFCITTVEEFNDSGDGKTIVHKEGFYPYQGDIPMDEHEIVANARLIIHAPCMFDYIYARARDGDLDAQQIILSIEAPSRAMQTSFVGAPTPAGGWPDHPVDGKRG